MKINQVKVLNLLFLLSDQEVHIRQVAPGDQMEPR